MDKETLSNYGWIVICVLVLAVMLALASPFGTFVANAVKSTTQGLFDVNQSALNSTGLINIEDNAFDKCDHDYETTTTASCTTAGTTTHTCKLCSKSYSEETPAGHTYDDTGLKCTECGVTVVEYEFKASDYDAKMGTTTKTDANVVIPETFEYNGKTYKVTSIGMSAFESCTALTSVTIPNSVRTIGYYAFIHCTSLKDVVIPDSVTYIAVNAFRDTGIEKIVIPDSVTTMGSSAFGYCNNLKEITIGSGVSKIGENVFNSSQITSIIVPDNVTVIEWAAFMGCELLVDVTLPSTLERIDKQAFQWCDSLENVYYNGTIAQWNNLLPNISTTKNEHLLNATIHCTDGDITL